MRQSMCTNSILCLKLLMISWGLHLKCHLILIQKFGDNIANPWAFGAHIVYELCKYTLPFPVGDPL